MCPRCFRPGLRYHSDCARQLCHYGALPVVRALSFGKLNVLQMLYQVASNCESTIAWEPGVPRLPQLPVTTRSELTRSPCAERATKEAARRADPPACL